MTSQAIVILTTVSNSQEAELIANELLERHLVACVQILPAMESHYRWEGKREKSTEILLICKTLSELQQQAMDAIRNIHSYQVPEIIAIPTVGVHPPYLDWLSESVLS